jgi:hypothetical protein
MELQRFIPIVIIATFVIIYSIYFSNRRNYDVSAPCDSYTENDRCVNICPNVPGTESELKNKLIESFDIFDNKSTIQILRLEIKCGVHEKVYTDKSKDWSIREVRILERRKRRRKN